MVTYSAAVGVVVLRRCPVKDVPQVLLIQRGKPPATGGLCFPGGRVELGEGLSVAATREVKEETGIDVLCLQPPKPLELSVPDPDRIPYPRPVTTIDGIYFSEDGKLAYHYAIVEVLMFSPRSLRILSGQMPQNSDRAKMKTALYSVQASYSSKCISMITARSTQFESDSYSGADHGTQDHGKQGCSTTMGSYCTGRPIFIC